MRLYFSNTPNVRQVPDHWFGRHLYTSILLAVVYNPPPQTYLPSSNTVGNVHPTPHHHPFSLNLSIVCLLRAVTTLNALPSDTSRESECAQHAVRSDQCLQDLTMTRVQGLKFPSTEHQLLTDQCSRLDTNLNCVSSYRTCLRTVQRTAFDTVCRNLKRFFRSTCKSRDLREKTVTNLNCFKSNEQLKRMSDEFTLLLELSAKKSGQDWLKYTCCSFHYFQVRLSKTVQGACARNGIRTDSNFFLDATR